MPDVLSPVPKLKFFNNNGSPLNGGKLFTYAAGTSTKIATYVNSSGVTTNANPIILDFRGEADVWIPPNTAYKYVLAPATDTDPPTNSFWSVDNLASSQLITLYGGVDTGSANAYVLNFTANFSAYTDGIVIYWVPSNTNTTVSTLNVNGLGAVSIVSASGVPVIGGQIIANQIVQVMYKAGSFILLNSSIVTGFYTGTLSGMTVATTGTITYQIASGICSLSATVTISGTSNSVLMVLSGGPAVITPSAARIVPCTSMRNNGATVMGHALAFGNVSFRLSTVSGALIVPGDFTAAGTKGLEAGWTISYPL